MDLQHDRDLPRKRRRRWIQGPLFGLALVLALAVWAWLRWNEPRPRGEPGPGAEALARKMLAAVNDPAWRETGAVRWTFAGKHDHLWDRTRQLDRVRWKDYEVLLDLTSRTGTVLQNGIPIQGEQAAKRLGDAWSFWINDSFWLNPVSKLFDEGTRRSLVPLDGGNVGMLIEYTEGGTTPGDAYLWIVDDEGLPFAWKMWVSIIPLGGIRTSWEEWVTLSTGAKVATLHQTPLGPLRLTTVAGTATLAELEPGPDPFAALHPE